MEQMGHVGAGERKQIKHGIKQYLFSHPAIAVAGVTSLTDQSSNRYAQELLGELQPEDIREFVSVQGRLARREDFTAAFALYDRPGGEVARAMVHGYLTKPTKQLNNTKEVQGKQEAALVANKVGLALVEALELLDSPFRIPILKEIDGIIYSPLNPDMTLIDLLNANASYAKRKSDSERAYAIYFALNMMYKTDAGISFDARQQGIRQLQNEGVKIGQGLFMHLQVFKEKRPPPASIWENPKQEHTHQLQQEFENFAKLLTKYLRTGYGFFEPSIFTFETPLPYGVTANALRGYLREIRTLLNQIGFDTLIIATPGRRTIFAALPEDRIVGKFIDPEVYVQLQNEVYRMVHDGRISELEEVLLPASEVNTIIEYLKDKVLSFDPKIIEKALPIIVAQAQTGLSAIGSTVIHNRLKLAKEEFLREMGLTGISFNYIKDGTQITAWWGKKAFTFVLDFNGNIKGLEGFSEENRKWFEMVTLMYLSHQRHPEQHPIQSIEPEDTLEIPNAEADEDVEDSKDDTPHGEIHKRKPYLRVMSHGYMAWQTGNETTNAEVLKRWGMSLDDINRWLSFIVSDKTKLDDPDSEFNQMLVSHQWGKGLKLLFQEILDNIYSKDSKPRWREVVVNPGSNEARYVMLLPTVAKRKEDLAGSVWRVAFIREIKDRKATGEWTTSPEVGDKFYRLADANEESDISLYL